MKNQKLINGLTLVIDGLKDGTMAYIWEHPHTCNMGLLARAIAGIKNPGDMALILSPIMNSLGMGEGIIFTWTNMATAFCPLTGMSEVELFKVLQKAGLSRKDMIQTENLSNPIILERSGIKITEEGYHMKKENVIKYFEAWKEILLEKENPQITKERPLQRKEVFVYKFAKPHYF